MQNFIKKIAQTICLIGIFLLAFSNGLAQERNITKEEMSKLLETASILLKSQPYRMKTASKSFGNETDSPSYWNTSAYLFETNHNGYHTVYYSKNKNNQTKQTETIVVNNRHFSRENDEPWKEISQDKLARRIGAITKVPEETIVYKYIGKEEFDGKKYDLYEKTMVTKFSDNRTIITLEKTWFDDKGRFFRSDTALESGGKLTYHSITEYEYDPKDLKIEVPIE